MAYIIILTIVIVAGILAALFYWKVLRSPAVRRALWFKSPFPESGGIGHLPGLTAVEAGIAMSVDIPRLLAMYVFNLTARRDIKIEELRPLKVKILADADVPEATKKFMDAVKEDGTLDLKKLLEILDFLYAGLNDRIRSYSVKDTVEFYLQKADSLWREMAEASINAEKFAVLEREFPWLLLHEEALERLEEVFQDSRYWPAIKTFIKTIRYLKDRMVDNEQLLEHAARCPAGIFLNRKYREDVVEWAEQRLTGLSVVPAWFDISIAKMSEEKQKKRAEHADRIRHLLDIVKHPNDSGYTHKPILKPHA